jgi:sugar phosphate isomerase/epimerase
MKNINIKWRMNLEDFLKRAKELGVDAVSLEGMHVTDQSPQGLKQLKEILQRLELKLVWSGVSRGIGVSEPQRREVADDVIKHIHIAKFLGADVCRLFSGFFIWDKWNLNLNIKQKIHDVIEVLKMVVSEAEQQKVKLAVENHADFTSDQLVEVIERVNNKWVGVTLDIGNPLAVFEDPVEAAAKLAPYTFATHIKDYELVPLLEDNGIFPYGFKVIGTCLGTGIIDIPRIIKILKDTKEGLILSVETHTGFGDEDKCMEICIKYLREVLETMQ